MYERERERERGEKRKKKRGIKFFPAEIFSKI